MCMSPWTNSLWDPIQIPPGILLPHDLISRRTLFRGPFGYVWYLGERVGAQYAPTEVPWVPVDPPPSMFSLNAPVSSSVIGDLQTELISMGILTLKLDYDAFRRQRLASLVVKCEIRTRVSIPEARVRVVGPDGEECYEEIPMLPDPVDGLPFPLDSKGFDRADSEQIWQLFQALMRRVADLSKCPKSMVSLSASSDK